MLIVHVHVHVQPEYVDAFCCSLFWLRRWK